MVKSKLGDLAGALFTTAIGTQLLGEATRNWLSPYQSIKQKKYQEVTQMETKSRYEVIAELEERKRELILEGDAIDAKLKQKEKELKELKRRIEDKEEEIKEFKENMKQMKDTNKELIKSIDESLKRFETMNKKEK